MKYSDRQRVQKIYEYAVKLNNYAIHILMKNTNTLAMAYNQAHGL